MLAQRLISGVVGTGGNTGFGGGVGIENLAAVLGGVTGNNSFSIWGTAGGNSATPGIDVLMNPTSDTSES